MLILLFLRFSFDTLLPCGRPLPSRRFLQAVTLRSRFSALYYHTPVRYACLMLRACCFVRRYIHARHVARHQQRCHRVLPSALLISHHQRVIALQGAGKAMMSPSREACRGYSRLSRPPTPSFVRYQPSSCHYFCAIYMMAQLYILFISIARLSAMPFRAMPLFCLFIC